MGQPPCEHCTALCCRYIALPIDTPEDLRDFDDIRWYLLHENISVFVEDGDWYICIRTRCRHLREDHRCQAYSTRPRICRRYDLINCDYHSGDYNWEHHFTCAEHLEQYLRERGARRAASNGSPRRVGHSKRTARTRRRAALCGKNGSVSARVPAAHTLTLHPPEAGP